MTATLTDNANWLASIGSDYNGRITDEAKNACQARGCSRFVWLCDAFAVKFTRWRYLRDNRNEWNFYYSLPVEVRCLLAKPLALSDDGTVLIMERMVKTLMKSEPSVDKATSLAEQFNTHLRKTMRKYCDYTDLDIDMMLSDNHANNLAYDRAGDIRWIDYAWSSVDI